MFATLSLSHSHTLLTHCFALKIGSQWLWRWLDALTCSGLALTFCARETERASYCYGLDG